MDDNEREDLINLGLMTLAGRVVVSNRPSGEYTDFFSQEGYPDNMPVRVRNGNKFEIVRKQARHVTPREYFANVPALGERSKHSKKLSKLQQFHSKMLEMRDRNLLDTTLPDYLGQGSDD